MKHLDLFSGIGGFALAARWAGIETIQFVEKDLFCQKVLRKHWPNVPIHDDIKTFSYKDNIDLLTGGFPCQPFSIAGNKKGIKDDRYLWPDMFRVIRESRPTWIIAENVPGIIPMLDPILKDLETECYTWQAYLVPASAIGAPHKRERLWIIANRDSERCDLGSDHRKERHLQDDWQRNIEKIQSEWPQFFPQSWETFNVQEWLVADTSCEYSNERTTDMPPDTERLEWPHIAAEVGSVISNPDSIPGEQTNKGAITESQEWNTRIRYSGQLGKAESIFNWQEDQPPIPGVDDGLPNGLDRNKSLGNAVVPQIPFIFMKLIMEISKQW